MVPIRFSESCDLGLPPTILALACPAIYVAFTSFAAGFDANIECLVPGLAEKLCCANPAEDGSKYLSKSDASLLDVPLRLVQITVEPVHRRFSRVIDVQLERRHKILSY